MPSLRHQDGSQEELDHQADALTSFITLTMDNLVPLKKVGASAKRWWDKNTLDPLKATTQQTRRLSQRQKTM